MKWRAFCFILFFLSQIQEIKANALSVLSINERAALEHFFSVYFLHDDFSYTLFGQKPMSYSGFGDDFDAEKFLGVICEEKVSLLDLIHHNDALLGILLGYGRHNALLFQKKAPLTAFSDIYDSVLTFIRPLGFACDPLHPETKKLDIEYQKTRGRISDMYSRNSFMEAILKGLCY